MAVKTVDKTATTKAWNKNIFFPKDNYILRCKAAKFGPNSNGNPMVTLEWEIVNQEPKQIGDQLIDFDGVTIYQYSVLKVVAGDDQEEATKKAFARYAELLERCGMDISEGIDDENPIMPKGKVVHASVYGKENASFASPTPEQRAKGQKVGSILKDPITGKDTIVYQPTIEQIYGPYDGEVKSAGPY